MNESLRGEAIKKVVGKKKRCDVWDELYRLNRFVAKIMPSRPDDNGHAVRKIVGKPREG
jgi:hypothetical protein